MLECVDATGSFKIRPGMVYKQIGEMYMLGREMRVNIDVNGTPEKGYYAKRFTKLPNFGRLALFS